MWILENDRDPGVHYLLCGASLNVSRAGNEHIILDDRTVSRIHASFCLTHNEINLNRPERLAEVILCDLNSANGTYVNSGIQDNIKLIPNEPVNMNHGDIIRFGKNSYWKLLHKQLVLSSSQIATREAKDTLRGYVQCLGGHLVREWTEDCSLLVMSDLVLTAKTVCALAAGAHIVTSNYFADMIDAVKKKMTMPHPKDYQPPLKEPSLNSTEVSFLPDPQRKVLFSGKTFLFQRKPSYMRMKSIVTVSGGSPVLLSESNYPQVTLENHILVKPPDKELANPEQFIVKAIDLLKEKGLCVIPESDIGLAIAYKSIDKYCNPSFKINGILQSRTNQSERSQNLVIFATETQRETPVLPSNPCSRTTVVESGESTKNKTSSLSSKSVSTSNQKENSGPPPQKQTPSASHLDDFSSTYVSHPSETLSSVKEEPADDKENIGKRKRSPSSEKNSPGNKRQTSKSKRVAEKVDLTETEAMATNQDEVDEAMGFFRPSHFSTERESPTAGKGTSKKRSKEGAFVVNPVAAATAAAPSSSRGNVRVAPSLQENDESSRTAPDNSYIPKSIPFAPYTLPSIRVEDLPSIDPGVHQEELEEEEEEEETQPFLGVDAFKQEPQSQSSQREETRTVFSDDEGFVVGNGHKNKVRISDERIGKETVKKSVADVTITTKNNPTRGGADEFALPFTMQRKRRGRGRSDESQTCDESSRDPKRSKMSDEPNQPTTSNDKGSRAPQSIKRSPSETENEREKEIETPPNSRNENAQQFISKQDTVKREKTVDEISKLGENLERSLVVIEVVSLVKKIEQPPYVKILPNGFPNFKKFKKVRLQNNVTGEGQDEVEIIPALPRIIGGRDLVCSTDINDRRESFLASQVDLREEVETRENERRAREENDKFDSDFNLLVPSRSRQRRRGRI